MKVQRVFLIGPPRTGTTLLIYLLAGQSDVLAFSEPLHAHSILAPWGMHRTLCRFQGESGLRYVRPPRRCSADALLRFLDELAERNGLRYVVIKETYHGGGVTPEWHNVHALDRLADRSEPLIAIIRHPYDTIASSIRLFRWTLNVSGWLLRRQLRSLPRFANAASIVRWGARNWTEFAQWAARRQLPTIRYEDLVSAPAAVLAGVCDHAGMPFDPSMLNVSGKRRALGGIGAPEIFLRMPRPVHDASVGRGESLSEEHKAVVREACIEAAAGFGYHV